ncbi:thiamine ABC transporter permease [Candidatus Atribacteria bacterium RBG_19FT_COMBO_35_14]|uniref:Thiamine ABC transporter permease n=1 Tax=Candidatus Sediminicultor quintus TaxID=1797291 RepID=A0A1F5AB44_9BACT|nr:MAG: thiamine ABC transporter permease [Candidatus Atribacteria bacterium RBG_19FT_COMBO_35_14]
MLKKFIAYYKPYWKLFTLDISCAFLIAFIDLAFPLITRQFINDIIPNNRLRMFYIFTIALLILAVVRAILNYIIDYWGHIVGTRMERDMRRNLFEHLQTLSFNYFDNVKTGHIMSRIVNDLREISELAHHGPEDLFLSLVMLIGSFIILATIEWRLTLIIYSFLPLLLWYITLKSGKMTSAFRLVRKRIANVNAQLENSISGIRVAKSFTNEEYEIEKFNQGNREFNSSREFAYKAMAEFFAGIFFLSNILNIVALSIGGFFVYWGYINIGDLVAYILYINFFLQPIRKLTNFTQQFQDGMTGFERFVEIMEVKPAIIDTEDAVTLKEIKGKIEFKNVAFKYGDKKYVLSDINLTIMPGETMALVGPSGGGKTTLCQLIPRFYEVNDGEILVDDINIKKVKIKSLRENIGMVQQDVFLFTGSIKENILYGKPNSENEEIIKAAKNANIHDFIMDLPEGYDSYIGEKGIKLSGGQKQRISLARAFLKDPAILILDEATSALDSEAEIVIQQALKKLTIGRTVLVIAHRLSTIKNAKQIVVLTDQGIKEKGNHDELIARDGLYSKLYHAQFRGFIPDEIE